MKAIIISAVIIITIFLITLSYIPIGIEPLTEVYFENHTQLPSNINLNTSYNYAFTINNLEHQKMRYIYNITAIDENNTIIKQLNTNELILEHNKSQTIQQSILFNQEIPRTKIKIEVTKDLSLETPEFKNKLWWPDPNYPTKIDIHFWIQQ